MTTPDLTDPLLLLSALPWMVLFAWVATRLLGAHRLSRRRVAAAGLLGYAGGLAVTLGVAGTDTSTTTAAWSGSALAIVLTMVAVIGLELIADRPTPALAPGPPRLPHPVRALRRRWQEAGRFAEISGILARLGLGHLFGIRPGRSSSARAEDVARRVRAALEEAGGIAIKLGQLLATRVNLTPPGAAREFAGLQERAPAVAGPAIRRTIESEYGRPVEEVFADFDWAPWPQRRSRRFTGPASPTGPGWSSRSDAPASSRSWNATSRSSAASSDGSSAGPRGASSTASAASPTTSRSAWRRSWTCAARPATWRTFAWRWPTFPTSASRWSTPSCAPPRSWSWRSCRP